MFPTLPRLMLCLLLSLPISGCGRKETVAKESHNGMKPLSERVKERKARGKEEATPERTAVILPEAGAGSSVWDEAAFEREFAKRPGEPAEESAPRRLLLAMQAVYRGQLKAADLEDQAKEALKRAKDRKREADLALRAEPPELRAKYTAMLELYEEELKDLNLAKAEARVAELRGTGSGFAEAKQAYEAALKRKFPEGARYFTALQDIYATRELEEFTKDAGKDVVKHLEGIEEMAHREFFKLPREQTEPYEKKFLDFGLHLATSKRILAEAKLADRQARDEGSGAPEKKPAARAALEAALGKSFAEFRAE